MAVSKKGSRNIAVNNHKFRWRVTGSDEVISVVVWPTDNEDSRAVARVGYHNDWEESQDGIRTSKGQLIVTNRMVRELILHVGVEQLLENKGQINVGGIEEFYDIKGAVRSSNG